MLADAPKRSGRHRILIQVYQANRFILIGYQVHEDFGDGHTSSEIIAWALGLCCLRCLKILTPYVQLIWGMGVVSLGFLIPGIFGVGEP